MEVIYHESDKDGDKKILFKRIERPIIITQLNISNAGSDGVVPYLFNQFEKMERRRIVLVHTCVTEWKKIGDFDDDVKLHNIIGHWPVVLRRDVVTG